MSKKADNYTLWVEGEKVAGTALTEALDAVHAPGPTVGATQRAQSGLRHALAKEAGDIIYYDQVRDTQLGPVWVATGPRGLVAVEYNGSEENFRAYLLKHIKCQPQRSAAKVAEAKEMLRTYLSGERRQLNMGVDLSHITPFQRRVLEETRKVPRGEVSTYAEIAKRIGDPKAVRAVGQALRRNPVPIVVPCHRVIASDGSLGGYAGNLRDKRKIELLRLEGVVLV